MIQNYRANLLNVRGMEIPPGADDFLSVALPVDYQLDGPVGAATQVISVGSDGSATVTVSCGSMSMAHALLSRMYAEQQALPAESRAARHGVQLANGDSVIGLGVISRPGTLEGHTQSTNRSWTVLMQSAQVVIANGLAAALAAAGTV